MMAKHKLDARMMEGSGSTAMTGGCETTWTEMKQGQTLPEQYLGTYKISVITDEGRHVDGRNSSR